MKAKEFIFSHNFNQFEVQGLSEAINPDFYSTTPWTKSKEVNGITLTATHSNKPKKRFQPEENLVITASIDGQEIGRVYMRTYSPGPVPDNLPNMDLSGEQLYVDPEYRRKGIATMMYNFVQELGNTVVPTGGVTPDGKKFWRARQKSIKEDSFNTNFNQINSIITEKYPKEIMNLLLGMFPAAREAIVNQYNDEDGMPFAEWRRVIWDIGNYVLSGPVVVNGSKLPIDPDTEADRLAKYQQYIKDKDSGKPARYFRANDSDPRTIDFTKLPPITLAQTGTGMEVTDGNHRAFLAKMANKPLRAYLWKRQTNNHPNVAKIKALFSNQQGVAENFADGKRPQDKGDSVRHGIPKKATMAELEKASHSKGRKGQLARWQLNMRRGRKK